MARRPPGAGPASRDGQPERPGSATIVANRARTRGERERRSVPLSAFEGDDGGPTVDPTRWSRATAPGASHPPSGREEQLLAAETLQRVEAAIATLPPRQQEVIVLRDVQGWTPEDVGESPRPQRRQPARAAAPGAREGARPARALPERGGRVIHCRELVELVTDYLDGVLPADERAGIGRTSPAARAARSMSSSSAPRSR